MCGGGGRGAGGRVLGGWRETPRAADRRARRWPRGAGAAPLRLGAGGAERGMEGHVSSELAAPLPRAGEPEEDVEEGGEVGHESGAGWYTSGDYAADVSAAAGEAYTGPLTDALLAQVLPSNSSGDNSSAATPELVARALSDVAKGATAALAAGSGRDEQANGTAAASAASSSSRSASARQMLEQCVLPRDASAALLPDVFVLTLPTVDNGTGSQPNHSIPDSLLDDALSHAGDADEELPAITGESSNGTLSATSAPPALLHCASAPLLAPLLCSPAEVGALLESLAANPASAVDRGGGAFEALETTWCSIDTALPACAPGWVSPPTRFGDALRESEAALAAAAVRAALRNGGVAAQEQEAASTGAGHGRADRQDVDFSRGAALAREFVGDAATQRAVVAVLNGMASRRRADSMLAACPGYFSPAGLACMLPCPLGAYCPSPAARVDYEQVQTTFGGFQRLAGGQMTCGGQHTAARCAPRTCTRRRPTLQTQGSAGMDAVVRTCSGATAPLDGRARRPQQSVCAQRDTTAPAEAPLRALAPPHLSLTVRRAPLRFPGQISWDPRS